MTQCLCGVSAARKIVLALISIATLVGLMNFTGGRAFGGIKAALAMYEADHGRFPRKSSFHSGNGTTFPTLSIPASLLSVEMVGTADIAQLPLLPALGSSAQMNSFFDVFTELSLDGISKPLATSTQASFRITGDDGGGGGGGGGVWPIELSAMNLSINDPVLGSILVRESPTKASTGHYALTPLSTGFGYMADSFFDVFTELSLDGGGTWHEASSSIQMNLTSFVPEPTSACLALIAAVGSAMAARRRRS